MTEQTLKEYLEGIVSADVLNADLVNTVSRGRDVSYYKISDVKNRNKFIITPMHLVKLCRDIIQQRISLENLDPIVFALEMSDYFSWDLETSEGARVNDAISNWVNRESNNPVTIQYLQYCAFYLETGEHR